MIATSGFERRTLEQRSNEFPGFPTFFYALLYAKISLNRNAIIALLFAIYSPGGIIVFNRPLDEGLALREAAL